MAPGKVKSAIEKTHLIQEGNLLLQMTTQKVHHHEINATNGLSFKKNHIFTQNYEKLYFLRSFGLPYKLMLKFLQVEKQNFMEDY